MTSRQFAEYNGTPKNDIPENDIPENDIPENDIPENDIPENGDIPNNNRQSSATSSCSSSYAPIVTKVDSEDRPGDVPVMPMKKRPPMEKSSGWRKTALSKVGAKGGVLTLRDDLGYIQVAWKSVGADTSRNLVSVIKGSDAKWRVRWFSDSNGVRTATEILTDEQYKKVSSAMWRNRKLYREGFATANPFTA